MGLQILLKQRHFADSFTIPRSLINLGEAQSPSQSTIAIIFGSDQGLCGQFNQQIVHYAIAQLDQQDIPSDKLAIAGIGARVIPSLETAGYAVTEAFPVPRSASDITPQVQELVLTIEQWREEQQCDRILLFYNHPLSGASYESRHLQLLPLDPEWLRQLEAREWATSMLPSYTMNTAAIIFRINPPISICVS
ncbi:MAG: F0F1 ATP synthase subunit gamma [Coleofasciculus sp. G3-WIS-01]